MAREFRRSDSVTSHTRGWEKVDACRMQHEREDQQEHNTAGALSELSDEQLVGLVLSSSTNQSHNRSIDGGLHGITEFICFFVIMVEVTSKCCGLERLNIA